VRTELERYAERVLGPCRVEQDTSWEHGASCVLRVRDANGLGWYAKRHRRVEHHTREVAAYRRWVPIWGTRAPSLRAYDPALAALVVSEVPGVASAGDDFRRLAFLKVHTDACGLACWLFNERTQRPLGNAIFKWLLAEAVALDDARAIALQTKNVDCGV